MNKILFGAVMTISLMGATQSFADNFSLEIPQPVQSYKICNHDAVMAINDRAIPLSSGQPTYSEVEGRAFISRSPDVFIQRERLVRNSYKSLSASGFCR